ncbi:hypothetical protein KGY79_03295 [Candidatus Bipolaricaulota bacterium]|nr:hypothetical protein [Candidatus Bipolaricaulota bacterium]
MDIHSEQGSAASTHLSDNLNLESADILIGHRGLSIFNRRQGVSTGLSKVWWYFFDTYLNDEDRLIPFHKLEKIRLTVKIPIDKEEES